MDKPQASVIIISYNQERYIAQAIKSVLMQKTKFAYELILSDDHSTDRTPEIMRDYAREHSNIVLLLGKKNRRATRNYMDAVAHARGEFIVVFEGDDYWTDENKLQAQVDFLTENPDYFGVSHVLEMRDDNGTSHGFAPSDRRIVGKNATAELFLKGVTFSCMATMYRADFLKAETWQKYYDFVTMHPMVADFSLCMLFLDSGRIRVLREPMSVYRISSADAVNQSSYNTNRSMLAKYEDHLKVISYNDAYFKRKYHFGRLYLTDSFWPFLDSVRSGSYREFRAIFCGIPFRYRAAFVPYVAAKCIGVLFDKLRGGQK